LSHAISQHLAAAEFDLIAIHGKIPFHLDKQLGIGQADAVPHRRTEHLRVSASVNA
jgi:hypothetical protein